MPLRRIQYRCPVPVEVNMIEYVSIINDMKATCQEDISYYVKVILPLDSNNSSIAICSLISYRSQDAAILVEWFEAQRLLGVNKIVTYTQELNSDALRVLDYYESIGLAEVIREFDMPEKEVTNQKKNELWKVITEEVNVLGVCMRSEIEVRNKYRNMCRCAKEKFTNNRKEMSKTGGGPPPTQLTIAEENIVNAMRDSASFIGVGGLETEITCNEENPATNGSQSPCTATPRPTAEKSVWIRALDRHHSNLQNNEQTCPVADDAEGTDRNATCPGPSSSASSQSKRSSSSCSIQPTPSKKKKRAEDVYALQCAVLEKELEKNTLQVDLLKNCLANMTV
ncbi:unnamed protein product [Mytilus coruscus]|uniref:Myb/SANT-like DNA-binding domain-containing protein n=1 Tax=Mytilus coruscus TaxID=42192 RepID=A0A6J8BII6_MYTCO|nr:unnamed protein product [Mytilus coruscus]